MIAVVQVHLHRSAVVLFLSGVRVRWFDHTNQFYRVNVRQALLISLHNEGLLSPGPVSPSDHRAGPSWTLGQVRTAGISWFTQNLIYTLLTMCFSPLTWLFYPPATLLCPKPVHLVRLIHLSCQLVRSDFLFQCTYINRKTRTRKTDKNMATTQKP